MRAIAIILLLAVFIRHGSINWLADASGAEPWAVNYILGGAEEAALALMIAVLLLAYRAGIWRNLGLGACVISVIEGTQIAGCSLLISDIRDVPSGWSLCEYLAGFQFGMALVTAYLAIVCYSIVAALPGE